MKTTSKILVCLLGVIFIFSSLGTVWAVDPSPTPTIEPSYDLVDQLNYQITIQYIIWTLNAWGIYVDEADMEDFTNQLTEWLFEYLAEFPSIGGWAQWVLPWSFYSDYWGNTVGNTSFLEDMEDFANWLVYKLSLGDDDIYIVPSSVYLLGTMKVYSFPLYGFQESSGQGTEIVKVAGPDTTYAIITGQNKFKPFIKGANQSLSFVGYYSTTQQATDFNFQVRFDSPIGSWRVPSAYANGEVTWATNSNTYLFQEGYAMYTVSEANQALQYNSYLTPTGLTIKTREITFPSDDPDYTSGDSLVIIDDGSGGAVYVTVEWPDSINVSNLPAVISTGTIPTPGDELNPGLVNAWHPISTLIEMTADSMGMLLGIIYEFPEEVLIPIFAVLGGIIIFGVIHAMKEH